MIFDSPVPSSTQKANREELQDQSAKYKVVTPGEVITSDPMYMRGHGTYSQEDSLVAAVAGQVDRVNKLVSVRPVRSRFTGEIGDVVVGRITEVAQKRWKVDINARQDAILLLSSVNLPGGVQRRKSESDELKMRSFFTEGHLLSAEVQAFYQDGSVSLHTRSMKYGKLRNGTLIQVPSTLVKRSTSHFVSLPCGVDLVLGLNGYIWVSKHMDSAADAAGNLIQPEDMYSNENEEISDSTREAIARVCNCIQLLAKNNFFIKRESIICAYEASSQFQDVFVKENEESILLELKQSMKNNDDE